MTSSPITYTFHVNGMHCRSCELTLESELNGLPGVTHVEASLGNRTLTVSGEFAGRTPEEVAAWLSESVHSRGYSFSVERNSASVAWRQFRVAVPLALLFAALFVGLQKMGIVNLVGGGTVTYGTAFVIGIIASVSTCMAVVGGLVLSMSATFAKEGDRVRPQTLFHIGRLLAFFVLGGLIGAVGAAFTLTATATAVLSVVIGLVMLILGINLLDIVHTTKRFQLTMPKVFSRHIHGLAEVNHTLTPFLVGIATFFLPCGFTQSMQLYTLTTSSFLEGALTMTAFALGTLPVLALLSFSSMNIAKSSYAGVFFKTAGLVVILFALLNLTNSLVIMGVLSPVFDF